VTRLGLPTYQRLSSVTIINCELDFKTAGELITWLPPRPTTLAAVPTNERLSLAVPLRQYNEPWTTSRGPVTGLPPKRQQ
jgi:hypothetical protein